MVHVLYNPLSVCPESLACALVLKLGQHRHCLLTQSHTSHEEGVCTQCSCSGAGSSHGAIFLY